MMDSRVLRLRDLLLEGLNLSPDQVSHAQRWTRGDESLWPMARGHKVAGILAPLVLKGRVENRPSSPRAAEGGDTHLATEAREVWHLGALRAQAYLKEYARIAQLWRVVGIESYPLKGLYLSGLDPAHQGRSGAGARVFRDMDLLLKSQDIHAASEVLIKDGYQILHTQGPLKRAPLNRGDALQAAVQGLDAVSLAKGDYYIELHTRLMPKSVGEYAPTWPPSPSDHFIHLCVHATRHHFLYGLRHLADLWMLWRAHASVLCETDLSSRVMQAGLAHLVYPAWALAHELGPKALPAPQGLRVSGLCRRYTRRVQDHLIEMPWISQNFEGSPLAFMAMAPGGLKRLGRQSLGTREALSYQLGHTSRLKRGVARLKRPLVLVWRHAPPVSHLMVFLLGRKQKIDLGR